MDELPPKLLTTLSQAADTVRSHRFIQVFSHFDADGVSSAAILAKALLRAGKEFKVTLFTTLNDYNMNVIRAAKGDCIIVSDLGASYIDQFDEMELPVIVLDHHTVISEAKRTIYANPHLYGIDGMTSGCGATMCLLFAVTLDEANWDLVQVAFAGIAGDRQHINGLSGLNVHLLAEGEKRGFIKRTPGSLIPSGNLMTRLFLDTDPYIRGVSGDVDGVAKLLEDAGVSNGKSYSDLTDEEKRRLSSLIAVKMTAQGVLLSSMNEVARDRYELKDWGMDAESLASLLNSCGRSGIGGAGIAAGMGDERCLRMAADADEESARSLVQAMKALDERGLTQMKHLQWFDSTESGFTGMLCGVSMQSIADPDKPTIGLNLSGDPVNISSRGMWGQLERGIDLAAAMREACASVGGAGGGHKIAAGGSVPAERVQEFLDNLDSILGRQLSENARSAPSDVHLVGPEPLADDGFGNRHPDPRRIHLGSEPRDHRAVVPTVLPVGYVHLGSARVRHILDHVPETSVLGYASAEEDLLLPDVGHGALGDLREHGESRLLDGERYVLERNAFPAEGHRRGYHAREGDIHPLHRIRELVILRALARQPLYLGAGVEPHPEIPAELVQHVAYADVLRLSEDPVPPFGERYDLRVASGSVEERRIPAAGEGAADLDVRYAVVDPDYRDAEGAGERPRRSGGDPQARAQSGPHRERYEVYILGPDTGLVQGAGHHLGCDLRMVVGGLARMESSLRRTEHVELVRKDVAVGVDYPYAQGVGGPLDSQCKHLYRLVDRRMPIKTRPRFLPWPRNMAA